MHGTGVWLGAMIPQLGGAAVVTLQSRSLDADEMLRTVQREARHQHDHRRRRVLQADHRGHRRGRRGRHAVRPVER